MNAPIISQAEGKSAHVKNATVAQPSRLGGWRDHIVPIKSEDLSGGLRLTFLIVRQLPLVAGPLILSKAEWMVVLTIGLLYVCFLLSAFVWHLLEPRGAQATSRVVDRPQQRKRKVRVVPAGFAAVLNHPRTLPENQPQQSGVGGWFISVQPPGAVTGHDA
jgi:hypothetical protein